MIKIISLSTAVVFFVSCGNKKSNQDYTVQSMSDSIQFIKIADAETFLPTWKKENTLVYHVLAEPDNLHPTNGKTLMRSEVMMYTQQYLVNVDFYSNSLRASLLKQMPVLAADGLSYACELRDDAMWDNGDKLLVDDVIFTLKANKCPLVQNEHLKPYLETFTDIVVDADNPAKFTVKVSKPYIQNIAIWSDIVIMQRKYYDIENVFSAYTFSQLNDTTFQNNPPAEIKKWADDFNSSDQGFDLAKLNGMGMYKVADWQQGQYLTLERKHNHWTANESSAYVNAYPDKIIFQQNKDPNATSLEFKKQNYDASVVLSTKALLDLQSDSSFNANYNSRFVSTYNYSYAAFNTKPDGIKQKKIFNDITVRRAVAMLVPYDMINQSVYMGNYKRQTGPVCSHKQSFNTNLIPTAYNFNEAVKLLANAGWKDTDNDGVLDKEIDGIKTRFEFALNIYANIPDWRDFALLMAGEMKKAGIVLNINPLEVQTFLENAQMHNFDMLLGVWSTSVSPDDFTQIWHTQSWKDNGSNYAGFGNEASDALIDSIKNTMDYEKRIVLEKRFQQMVTDEQPYIFLFNSQRRTAVHKRFGNCEMFFEKPGLLLNNLKLLDSSPAAKADYNP